MVRGGYTFEQIRKMDSTEILFLHHYQELNKRMYEDFVTQALGIVWDRKDFIEKKVEVGEVGEAGKAGEAGATQQRKIPDKLFIPLSMAINPDINEYVKRQFNVSGGIPSGRPPWIGGGSYAPKPNEVVHSIGDLSKNEFLKMIGKRR